MAKNNNKNNEEFEENNSPVVNVEWKPLDWVDQFQKFIVDLTGAIDDRNNRN
jgi:hypothetical protein